jgi:hypothetical protein
MKRGKEEPGMVDVVVAVAAVCLAVIVLGLIFPASRSFAIAFGSFVFIALMAAGIGVLTRVGWILVRHAVRRR